MRVGDFVEPKHPHVLRSGCSQYSRAVVVSIDPFVLVSEHADMKWSSTVKKENFIQTGDSMEDGPLEQCLDRLTENER